MRRATLAPGGPCGRYARISMRCLSQVRVPSLPLNLTRARPCGTPALVAGVARYSGHSARARLVAECGKRDVCTLPASSSFRSNGPSNGLPEHSLNSHKYCRPASRANPIAQIRTAPSSRRLPLRATGRAAAAPPAFGFRDCGRRWNSPGEDQRSLSARQPSGPAQARGRRRSKAAAAQPPGRLAGAAGTRRRRPVERPRRSGRRLQERLRERRERDSRPEIDFARSSPARGTSISQPDPLISRKTAWLSGMCPHLPAEDHKRKRPFQGAARPFRRETVSSTDRGLTFVVMRFPPFSVGGARPRKMYSATADQTSAVALVPACAKGAFDRKGVPTARGARFQKNFLPNSNVIQRTVD